MHDNYFRHTGQEKASSRTAPPSRAKWQLPSATGLVTFVPLDGGSAQGDALNMSVTSATTIAAQILSNTLAVLKTVREQSKESKDATLKGHISDLYDSVLSLKEAVMLVTEENRQLRRRIAELETPPAKPVIKQVGLTNYYFLGDEGPFCQPCYSVKSKLVPLAPQNRYAGGIGRKCEVCNKVFFESNEVEQMHVQPFIGPDDWMR